MAGLSCVYELRSINLANLPEKEQARVLDQFASFLNSLTDPVSFEVVKDIRKVDALGSSYPVPYMRFFVGSGSQIDDLLAGLVGPGKFVRVPAVPEIGVSHVSSRYVVDTEQQLIQTFNITRLGGSMEPAFLTRVYGLAYSVRLQLLPIEPHQARTLSRQRAKALRSGLLLREMDGRLFNPEREAELQRVQAAAQSIAAGNERLFKAKVSIRLREKSYPDLVASRKKLRQALGGIVDEMDSPRYLQEPLLTDKGPEWARGQWFFLTTAAATVFFPFSGLDIIDPKGVFFGQSLQTGNAIIFDVFEKENYNLAVMGQTGYGKSTLVKTLFARMLLSDPDMCAFVFDSIVKPEYAFGPDGRYETSFAGITGCMVHRFTKEKGAGLDPFVVFPDKRRAANFLASVAKIEGEPNLVADLYIASDRSSSVADLMTKVEGELRKRLQANLPPYSFLFEGEMEVSRRMVFVLYDLPPGELRDAAAFLTLAAVWKTIQDISVFPVSQRKAIVIDEGWALVEVNPRTGKPYFQLAVEYVPEIARTARHYNTNFTLATQLVSDLMGRGGVVGPGREMVESCATKFVLKQDPAASATLREAFNLSDREERFITNAKIGQGVLLTQDGHLPFYNLLSDAESKLFTTRPKEVTG
ncbi:MAG: hypothetical protein JRN06_00160 [Nitrososphaerota archaeon]|nr:hypothetical protein [Nitrososphaerota archaeon]MDG7023735.1 hypothetical protein [Nitrososphaerota archaeon]